VDNSQEQEEENPNKWNSEDYAWIAEWDYVLDGVTDTIDKFNRTRKGRGKDHATAIMEYFVNEWREMDIKPLDVYWITAQEEKGWIRSSQIEADLLGEEIPYSHRTTLFRLLDDLVKAEILQKKSVIEKTRRSSDKKQKTSVYYRMLVHEPNENHFQVMTREELLHSAIEYSKGYIKLRKLYMGAKEYLKSDGIEEKEIDKMLLEFYDFGKKKWEYDMFSRLNISKKQNI